MHAKNKEKASEKVAYAWQCHACRMANPAEAISCSNCGCPGSATSKEIEKFRAQINPTVQKTPQQEDASKKLTAEILAKSRYRLWYRASIFAFICSLLIPNAVGLYMLALGWIALNNVSPAWLANPLLIAALILARPHGEPGSWRWLAYCSLVFMLTTPTETIVMHSPFPFCLWLASVVLLIIGMHRYRSIYRKTLAMHPSNNERLS